MKNVTINFCLKDKNKFDELKSEFENFFSTFDFNPTKIDYCLNFNKTKRKKGEDDYFSITCDKKTSDLLNRDAMQELQNIFEHAHSYDLLKSKSAMLFTKIKYFSK